MLKIKKANMLKFCQDIIVWMLVSGKSNSHFITTTHVTTPFAKRRFEKGFLVEIYSLCASERLLIYLHPILSHFFNYFMFSHFLERIQVFKLEN